MYIIDLFVPSNFIPPLNLKIKMYDSKYCFKLIFFPPTTRIIYKSYCAY